MAGLSLEHEYEAVRMLPEQMDFILPYRLRKAQMVLFSAKMVCKINSMIRYPARRKKAVYFTECLCKFPFPDIFRGKSVCEMGPGQYLLHPFLEYQLGADREVLLEIDDFADEYAQIDMVM